MNEPGLWKCVVKPQILLIILMTNTEMYDFMRSSLFPYTRVRTTRVNTCLTDQKSSLFPSFSSYPFFHFSFRFFSFSKSSIEKHGGSPPDRLGSENFKLFQHTFLPLFLPLFFPFFPFLPPLSLSTAYIIKKL